MPTKLILKLKIIMKKLLFTALAVFAFVSVNAQEDESSALSKGSWLVEANTGFGGGATGADTTPGHHHHRLSISIHTSSLTIPPVGHTTSLAI